MTARPAAQSGGSTSRSLLADAQLADSLAWERLVTLYAPLVASWCRRWGVPPQDIVDVLQEVFTAVSLNLPRFRKDRASDTFRGWLLTIARNKSLDFFQRRDREPAAAGGTEAARRMQDVCDVASLRSEAGAPPATNPNASLPGAGEDAAFGGVVRQALDLIRSEFQEQTWKAFWGVAVEGRSTADVAADLKMQPGAVRVAKSRVLLRLRRELGDLPEA
jgi:RNA polymerase sigma-70 factor (ECF subfamily)